MATLSFNTGDRKYRYFTLRCTRSGSGREPSFRDERTQRHHAASREQLDAGRGGRRRGRVGAPRTALDERRAVRDAVAPGDAANELQLHVSQAGRGSGVDGEQVTVLFWCLQFPAAVSIDSNEGSRRVPAANGTAHGRALCGPSVRECHGQLRTQDSAARENGAAVWLGADRYYREEH